MSFSSSHNIGGKNVSIVLIVICDSLKRMDWVDFWSKLAWVLTDNPYLVPEVTHNKVDTQEKNIISNDLASTLQYTGKLDGTK